MRTRSTGARRGVPARHALPWLLATALLSTPATATSATAQLPRPVSPGAVELGAISEARCPTFSWSGVAGARGYQIAVFRISEFPADEPTLVTAAQVDGDARSFTPTLGGCLERGHRYAWTVAALPDDPSSSASDRSGSDLPWAPALLFEVEGAPSPDEVERAIATLRRHLDTRPDGDADAVTTALLDTPGVAPPLPQPHTASPREARTGPARDTAAGPPADSFLPGALASPTTVTRIASAVITKTPGDSSFTVSNQIHLANASDLFKDGDVFLWDDTTGNTALGREALASVSGSADHNTAFGRQALRSTTGGYESYSGSYNTAVGDRALYANTTGSRNTASGSDALFSNTTGLRNTASGSGALTFNTTGHHNTASGFSALLNNTIGYLNTASGAAALSANTDGFRNTASGSGALTFNTSGDRNTGLGYNAGLNNTTGNDSIFINNVGASTDNATIKIGTQGTQASTFIAGISGVTVSGAGVVVNATTGQLGIASSSREVKRDISTLPPLVERLLALRPVSFRYRQLGANGAIETDAPLEYGFVAEEVAEIFPELVIFDELGKPQTVKYHLLGSLLLRALQEQQQALASQRHVTDRQRSELDRLREDHRVVQRRLAALESRSRR